MSEVLITKPQFLQVSGSKDPKGPPQARQLDSPIGLATLQY